MEFHQLRYFVAVAEERHFTKAARGLHVAQPSVSRAIRVLEEELGTSLFHRMKGNVALTPAGETLLPWARRVLADVDGATGEVRELADLRRGRLAVGATPSLTITTGSTHQRSLRSCGRLRTLTAVAVATTGDGGRPPVRTQRSRCAHRDSGRL